MMIRQTEDRQSIIEPQDRLRWNILKNFNRNFLFVNESQLQYDLIQLRSDKTLMGTSYFTSLFEWAFD